MARSAYDLWLTDNIKNATIVRADSIADSFALFQKDGCEVLAGLRPKLVDQQREMAGSTILDGSFTVVKQAIGCRPEHAEAAEIIREFVEESKANGFIAGLVAKYGVAGRLSVAPADAC